MATATHDATLIDRLAKLEARIAALERAQGGAASTESAPEASHETVPGPVAGPAMAIVALPGGPADLVVPTWAPPVERDAGVPGVGESEAGAATPPPADAPAVAAPASRINPVWAWITGGNALTRIGVVVLFFGVAFLLRYFAEHFTLPIELRLAAVAAAGVALIALGLRLAGARPGYGLSLQGAGAGILYLTIYAAFRLYAVLPDEVAIALLAAVAAVTVWLALRADSQALAGLAVAGGFLAPMLTATGGAPLPLFGYFAVLNGAIFALAWRRAWRSLNVLGFVFTFALGLFWGQRHYVPAHFATVEPFLALFFAFYVAIAILEARRGALEVRRPVDGLLVFGVPLTGFALQAALVGDTRYGAAWSAVALAGVYAVLHLALRRRAEPALALLAQAFLALAVIFATLAIPFAFDDQWTAALWAVEAAGVYWLGVRQASPLARGFALLVELGAGAAFAWSGGVTADEPLFANGYFIGAMLVALSGLATARFADRAGDALPARERPVTPLVFGWGAAWWLAAGGMELVRHLDRSEEVHAALGWVVASVALALAVGRAARWPRLATVGVALLPVMLVAAVADFERARTTMTVFGWLLWPAAWVVHWLALRAADAAATAPAKAQATASATAPWRRPAAACRARPAWRARPRVLRVRAHRAARLGGERMGRPLDARAHGVGGVRGRAAGGRVPVGRHPVARRPALAVRRARRRLRRSAPARRWRRCSRCGSSPSTRSRRATSSPLPYLPLANPLDLTLAAVRCRGARAGRGASARPVAMHPLRAGSGPGCSSRSTASCCAPRTTGATCRGGCRRCSRRSRCRRALTLTWTATALAVMFAATRRRLRPLWMVGAGLLAVVVGKLFLVDLGALSGLPRVVAFLGVGVLLLAIGYLSPLPPAGGGARSLHPEGRAWRRSPGDDPGRRLRVARSPASRAARPGAVTATRPRPAPAARRRSGHAGRGPRDPTARCPAD